MVDKKKSRKRKKKLTTKDSNVVDLFTGGMIPIAAKMDAEKTIKQILKDGGLKDRSFILITYNHEGKDAYSTYYTSGDTLAHTCWELDRFKLMLTGALKDE